MSGRWWELGPDPRYGRRYTPRINVSGRELRRCDSSRPRASRRAARRAAPPVARHEPPPWFSPARSLPSARAFPAGHFLSQISPSPPLIEPGLGVYERPISEVPVGALDLAQGRPGHAGDQQHIDTSHPGLAGVPARRGRRRPDAGHGRNSRPLRPSPSTFRKSYGQPGPGRVVAARRDPRPLPGPLIITADRGGRLAPARRPRGFFGTDSPAHGPKGYPSEAEPDPVLDADCSIV
jgi:hypothetical protein